ncbi:MAG: ParA family protein [Firmicutes bacterium]|nr:ParA family protein [Bacillota bacterium]
MARVLEAYVGEYASGKSENAINRGRQLASKGRRVCLVDLDLVEPFYTLRPLKRRLEREGLEVLAWETSEVVGLGEAAIPLKKEMKTALTFAGDVIFDLGYGVDGRKLLNLISGSFTADSEGTRLRLLMVVNTTRPLTSSVPLILAYLQEFGAVDGLINNTHLGAETTVEIIQAGAVLVTEAARQAGLPVVATAALRPYARQIGAYDRMGNPVRPLDRYMADAFW